MHTHTLTHTHTHTLTPPPHTHTIKSSAHSHLAKFQVPLLHRVIIIDSNVDLFLGWDWTDGQYWGLWWARTAGLGGVQMRVAWKRDSQSVKSPVTCLNDWGTQDKPQWLGNTGQTSTTGEHRTKDLHDTNWKDPVPTAGSTSAPVAGEHKTVGSTSASMAGEYRTKDLP